MPDAYLVAAFVDLRADIDSEPFAHEQWWIQWSGDQPKEDS
jgi:hypothetical protein